MPRKPTTAIHSCAMLLLRDKGMSQAKLSRRIGCSLTTIHEILLGRRTSQAIMKRIAAELGFQSWDALVGFADRFQKTFESLSEKEKQR